jgi:hypothetical protein
MLEIPSENEDQVALEDIFFLTLGESGRAGSGFNGDQVAVAEAYEPKIVGCARF